MSTAFNPLATSILDKGPRIECMKSGLGAGWLSSGVPEIGTKGTTKG
jgi:hypothetical protein